MQHENILRLVIISMQVIVLGGSSTRWHAAHQSRPAVPQFSTFSRLDRTQYALGKQSASARPTLPPIHSSTRGDSELSGTSVQATATPAAAASASTNIADKSRVGAQKHASNQSINADSIAARIAVLEIQYASLRARYSEDFQDVIQTIRQLDVMEKAMGALSRSERERARNLVLHTLRARLVSLDLQHSQKAATYSATFPDVQLLEKEQSHLKARYGGRLSDTTGIKR
jgi:hypothetical protein